MKTKLFSPLKLRELTFKNRIFLAPMCQYSALNGVPNNWHLVHLGARAIGGAALIIVEATGVVPEGRITKHCLGLYNDEQCDAFKPITEFIKSSGSIPGIQLAHSGRKAEGDWISCAPSAKAFSDRYQTPHELSISEIHSLVDCFVDSAHLALKAGFEVIEVHMAHGYLLHQFLSPLSNNRQDDFGGSLENRMRFPMMVAHALRAFWPSPLPVFVRLSATDWVDNGWNLEESIQFCRELKKCGIDFIDVSTGGNVDQIKIPVEPNYQVKFSHEIKKEVEIATGAVGLITKAHQAEDILQNNSADVVLLGREFLREPYWPIKAALELGATPLITKQYVRAYT